MSRITTTVALLLMATAACGQAKEDAGDGKQLDKQTMEFKDYLPEIHGTIRGKYEYQTETSESRFEVRNALFGYSKGETLATYWDKHNTPYVTVDFRFGVKATKEVAFQFMVNNLFNKEYSYRPMAVAAPRTFVLKMDVTF